MAVLLATGCGGSGNDSRASACAALNIPPAMNAAEAGRTLRRAIAADRKALDVLDADDPLAARFGGARTRAEQALRSFTGDPLRSRTMSPSATILPTAHRVVAETRGLRNELCR